MKLPSSKLRSTSIAALLSLPLTSEVVLAQHSQEVDQTPQLVQHSEDSVVATVGDAEIRRSDVMTAVGMLPPQLQSQPPETLVPMALERLILRELILQEIRRQNPADDPEVAAHVEDSAQTAEVNAMVQVWLDRELAKAVTDEAVQQFYMGARAQGLQLLPPMEALRPQIEQHLRRQAMEDIEARLRQGADIVLHDPSARPVEQRQEVATQQEAGVTR